MNILKLQRQLLESQTGTTIQERNDKLRKWWDTYVLQVGAQYSMDKRLILELEKDKKEKSFYNDYLKPRIYNQFAKELMENEPWKLEREEFWHQGRTEVLRGYILRDPDECGSREGTASE